ncbi:MAG: hypothetical protein ACYDHZ_09135 [Dehalococcoidia bacterium]
MKRFLFLALSVLLLLILIPACAPQTAVTPPAVTPPVTAPPPSGAFLVTSIAASTSPTAFTGSCPKTFTFTAAITATGPGTVTYRWESYDGTNSEYSDNQSLSFSEAGTKTTTLQWDLKNSATGFHRVHVMVPNDLVSIPVYYDLNCSSASLVTGVIVGVDQFPFTGPCPKTIHFYGVISTSGPGKVTYRWERSDGSAVPDETITFTSAGSQTVTNLWTRGGGGGWQRLHILTPNNPVSSEIDFIVNCN